MNAVFDFIIEVVIFWSCIGVDWDLDIFFEDGNKVRTIAQGERKLPDNGHFIEEVYKFDQQLFNQHFIQRTIERQISWQIFILQRFNSKLLTTDLSYNLLIKSVHKSQYFLFIQTQTVLFIHVHRHSFVVDGSIAYISDILALIESLTVSHGTFVNDFIIR